MYFCHAHLELPVVTVADRYLIFFQLFKSVELLIVTAERHLSHNVAAPCGYIVRGVYLDIVLMRRRGDSTWWCHTRKDVLYYRPLQYTLAYLGLKNLPKPHIQLHLDGYYVYDNFTPRYWQ